MCILKLLKASETADVKIGHVVLHMQTRLSRNNFEFIVNTNIYLHKLLKTLSRANTLKMDLGVIFVLFVRESV